MPGPCHTYCMTVRLNARIDEALAAKLERLRRRTHMTTTEIVRASVELYYERFQEQEAGQAHRILDNAGFVGCGEGEPALSTTYKERLADSLSSKAGS